MRFRIVLQGDRVQAAKWIDFSKKIAAKLQKFGNADMAPRSDVRLMIHRRGDNTNVIINASLGFNLVAIGTYENETSTAIHSRNRAADWKTTKAKFSGSDNDFPFRFDRPQVNLAKRDLFATATLIDHGANLTFPANVVDTFQYWTFRKGKAAVAKYTFINDHVPDPDYAAGRTDFVNTGFYDGDAIHQTHRSYALPGAKDVNVVFRKNNDAEVPMPSPSPDSRYCGRWRHIGGGVIVAPTVKHNRSSSGGTLEVYRSPDFGQSWALTSQPTSITPDAAGLFLGTHSLVTRLSDVHSLYINGEFVTLSADSGLNYFHVATLPAGITGGAAVQYLLCYEEGKVIGRTLADKWIKSTDYGFTWVGVTHPLGGSPPIRYSGFPNVLKLAPNPVMGVVCFDGTDRILRYTEDEGVTWETGGKLENPPPIFTDDFGPPNYYIEDVTQFTANVSVFEDEF